MECKKRLISVVVPNYNDKDIILPYYEAIKDYLSSQAKYDWELIYVDDGSDDGSVEVLKELASLNENITFIELSRNFGQQNALFCGLAESHGDIVITLDGDYQYPSEVIIQLADKINEGYDIVSGVRVIRKDPILDRVTSKIGQFFIKKIICNKLSDFGAAKGFSRFMVEHILKNKMYTTQIYGLAYKLTNKYCEIPVKHSERYSGESKWSFWARVEMYLELFLLFGEINLRPVFLFSFLMFIVGSLYFIAVVAGNLFFDYQIGTGVGSLILFSTGLIAIFTTLIINIVLKIYKSISYKEPIIIRSMVKKNDSKVL